MRFLFINPNRAIQKRNIWSVVNSITPPLGLATLSAVLEKEGHQADIIDASALNLGTSEIISRIDRRVDIVGLTATTPEIENAINIANEVRNHFPGVKIIMGGVHPTIFHEELTAAGICDMVIRGEGEDVIPAIAEQKPLEKIPNLTWKSESGDVVINQRSDRFVDLDKLPFPSYSKLPMQKYRSALGAARRSPSIGMITSRGCPGQCTFCFSGMFGSKIRFMSPRRVLEHILYLKANYGIKEISFYDDTFTANRKRVEDLCRSMIDEKIDISWSCFARVDTVNPDILRLMKEAGCHQICYGFESADEDILKAINKKIDTDKSFRAALWTKEAGIDIRGAFMLGNPGETEDSLRRTLEYSKKLGIQFATYNITTPFPGTALYDSAVTNGSLKHTAWSFYDLAHPVLELQTVSSEVIQDYYYRAYKEFYFRHVYILQRLFSIRTKDEIKAYIKAFTGILLMLTKVNIGKKIQQ